MTSDPDPRLFADLAPEFRLLCLAACRAERDAVAAACADIADWRAVWSGARRHRVAAPLFSALGEQDAGRVPGWILERLQRQVVQEAMRCRALAQELAALTRQFDQASMAVLALKGIPLAVSLYGTAAGRGVGDIDLLVAPADLAAADCLLRQGGFQRQGATVVERGPSPYLRRLKEITYIHPTRGTVVELHQRLTENPHLLAWDHHDLWRQRQMVEIDATPVATLPRDRLPVYLAMHGACHCWERLRWLADLADLLRAPGAVEQAARDAQALGLSRPMGEALALCHHWLGLPVDGTELPDPQALAPFVRRFFAASRWKAAPRPGSLEWLRRHSWWGRLYRLSLRSCRRYRLWELSATMIWPPDWDVIPLPGRLFWLYPLLRPLGWLLRRRRRRP
jgi:hypothetical protein